MQTPEDDLLVQFQGMIAEYERAQIAERSRRGKCYWAQRGEVSIFGCAPYGYRSHHKIEDSDTYYEVIEVQGLVIRAVYDDYSVEHMSIGEITRKLNDQGVPTATDRQTRWERSTLWGILRNPAYQGKICQQTRRKVTSASRRLLWLRSIWR